MAVDEQAENQRNPQPQGYRPTAGYGPAEDEIDLADLAAVLFRWKWVIIGLTLIFGCAAFGATSVMTEKYHAETVVQIGQVPVPERQVGQIKQGTINIEMKTREEAAAEKLRGFARQVFASPPFEGSAGFSLQKDLTVSASEDGGGIVEIRLEAPRSADPLDFLTRLNEKLIKDHEQMIHMDRASLNSRIKEIKNRIKEHQAKKSSFLKRLERLKKEESFLKQELETVREQLSRLVQAVNHTGADAAGEPLETFLLGTELHRIQASQDQIYERLTTQFLEKRQDLFLEAGRADSAIREKQNDLEILTLQKDSVNHTKVLVPPFLSKQPVSPNLGLNVILALMAGFFMSVFLAFLLEFWQRNKDRIKSLSAHR